MSPSDGLATAGDAVVSVALLVVLLPLFDDGAPQPETKTTAAAAGVRFPRFILGIVGESRLRRWQPHRIGPPRKPAGSHGRRNTLD